MEITNKIEAKQLVDRFLKRFDNSYKALLCHAALPLILTPELLHYIRNSFVREVKWLAEVDLLLSDLCHKVGYELYAMDTNVRAYLIEEMEKTFGQKRMQEIASLLIKYLKYLSQNNIINQSQLQYQKWGALVYLDKKHKQEVANEIAESFSSYLKPVIGSVEVNLSIVSKDQLNQLSLITKEFAPQLAKYPELINCAETIYNLLANPLSNSNQIVNQLTQLQNISTTIKEYFPSKWVTKVAFVSIDPRIKFLPTLSQLANQANQAQDYYHFQVSDISIPNEIFLKSYFQGSGNPQTMLPELEEYVTDLHKTLKVDLICCLTTNLISFQENGHAFSNFFCADINKDCFAVSTHSLIEYAQKAETNLPKSILFLTLGMLVAMESKWTIDYHDRTYGCLFDKCIEHSSIVIGLSNMKFVHEECRKKITNKTQLDAIDKLLALNPNIITHSPVIPTSLFEFVTVKVNAKGKITERSKKQAKQFIEDLGNGVILEMVEIPGGTFMMGSPEKGEYDDEKPQHQVIISSFYMGKYQTTQGQWKAIMGNNPSYFKGDDNLPVEQVSWNDVVEFCKKLSERTKKTYRLPSEAEWEYACRAGSTTAFAFGETITPEIVNHNGDYPYGEAPKGKYRGKTISVGSLGIANEFGLYDMHGNVWEWCQDPWHNNYKGAPTDGSTWAISSSNNTNRILRGGSYYDNADYCRCALRLSNVPDKRYHTYGFRVVMIT